MMSQTQTLYLTTRPKTKVREGEPSKRPRPAKKRRDGRGFISVHFGAGSHTSTKEKEKIYKALSNKACKKGMGILKNGGSADDAVTEAMKLLEDSGKLNAGKGSYLTVNEKVEVDAGFISGNGRFAGVGAAPGIPNPCLAAKALANLEMDVIVPPNLLVGAGAKTWAASVGLETCDDKDLVCKRAKEAYDTFLEDKTSGPVENEVIGCIALDDSGHVAACGSTGGGLYKIPGTVDPIAQYGCGIFAEDISEEDEDTIATAIAATGTGELLTELRFAQTCAKKIRENDSSSAITGMKEAMDLAAEGSSRTEFPRTPITAMIGLTWNGKEGEFIVAHTAENFVYAYAGTAFGDEVIMECSENPASENEEYALEIIDI